MDTNQKRRPSPATAIALLALFIALGGSAYAINKIGTNQIKNGAVTKPKLAKNVKRLLNQKARPGPRGERGPRGLQGATGPAGATGPQGLTGAPGLIDPNRLYEKTASRTGSGAITVTCDPGDWVITGWVWGSNVVAVGSMGPQNARREWRADIILGNEAMTGSVTATCYDA